MEKVPKRGAQPMASFVSEVQRLLKTGVLRHLSLSGEHVPSAAPLAQGVDGQTPGDGEHPRANGRQRPAEAESPGNLLHAK